jgi:hypothetical protein
MRVFQSIITRYHGATATRGPRYSATTTGGIRIYIQEDPHWIDDKRGHVEARNAMVKKLKWGDAKMAMGALRDGIVHVFTD